MKTLNVIAVVESAILDQAVEVTYCDLNKGITAVATVVNVDGSLVITGTATCKYTWMQDDIVVRAVARNCDTGRFVSIKDTKEDIKQAAIELAADLLGMNDVVEEDTQVSVIVASPIVNVVEDEVVEPATEECVVDTNIIPFEVQTVIIPEPIVIKPLQRGVNSMSIQDTGFKFQAFIPETDIVKEELDPRMDANFEPPVFDDYDPMLDVEPSMSDYDICYYVGGNPDYQQAVEVQPEPTNIIEGFQGGHSMTNVDVSTDCNPVSDFELVKQCTHILYNYFDKGCHLKSVNKQQLKEQFEIVWNKHMIELHAHQSVVSPAVLHPVYKELLSVFETTGYTYMYKAKLMATLRDAIKRVTIKAKNVA